uniref:Uncharacterized protein n=1 Tax=Oryza meridionalis TaxID=40149 RepID=A0A0E0F986_9ORYZ
MAQILTSHVHVKNTAGEVTNQASHDHDPTQSPIESIEEPTAEGSDDIYGGLTPIIDLPTGNFNS